MRVLVGGQTPLPAHLAGANQDQGGPPFLPRRAK